MRGKLILQLIDKDSIAIPKGSVPDKVRLCPTCTVEVSFARPKKTSGLVHVATALLICVVKKDNPTWYAAGGLEGVRTCTDVDSKKRTIHPSETLARNHFEI